MEGTDDDVRSDCDSRVAVDKNLKLKVDRMVGGHGGVGTYALKAAVPAALSN
jgi:hypothetical protein